MYMYNAQFDIKLMLSWRGKMNDNIQKGLNNYEIHVHVVCTTNVVSGALLLKGLGLFLEKKMREILIKLSSLHQHCWAYGLGLIFTKRGLSWVSFGKLLFQARSQGGAEGATLPLIFQEVHL